jgi:hypothetical protein
VATTNTILTPNIILREVYAIMHQQSNFIMRTNRQYDSRFAQTGYKIGQTLDIRLPAKYTVRTGNAMSAQNTVERKVTLPLGTIKGVDMTFGQEELTFSIDDFSARILRPAVSQLTATVEDDAISGLYKTVANYAGAVGSAVTYKSVQQAGQYMSEELAPKTDRTMLHSPQMRVDFSDAVKGLFQDSSKIAEQYTEGLMGRTAGFDHFENTLAPLHTPGTYGGTPLTNGANQGNAGTGNAYVATSSIITDGWTATTTTLKAGDIITIGGVFAVHPESKKSLGRLRRFVVVSDTVTDGSGNSTFTVSPAIISGGAYQNVTNLAGDNQTITVLGTSATAYGQGLAFHRDAFAFVTADLEDPSQYGAWGARETLDNLSIRIWRQGDIINGTFPCRLDIAYGYVAVYPEWAAREVYLPA